MAVDFFIKQGDTSPAITAILKDGLGVAVNLTGISAVRFIMVDKATSVGVVDAPAQVITAATGRVAYQWIAGDTDLPSTYKAEFEVTFADDTVETFPNSTYITVKVVVDLGGTVG